VRLPATACILLIASLIPTTGGCGNSVILDGSWRLISNGVESLGHLQHDQVPSFEISGTSMSGFDGCNKFSSRLDDPGSTTATRMGCAEETIMLPLDFANLRQHLDSGSVKDGKLHIPAHQTYPAVILERY
jgi:hypothetical protein